MNNVQASAQARCSKYKLPSFDQRLQYLRMHKHATVHPPNHCTMMHFLYHHSPLLESFFYCLKCSLRLTLFASWLPLWTHSLYCSLVQSLKTSITLVGRKYGYILPRYRVDLLIPFLRIRLVYLGYSIIVSYSVFRRVCSSRLIRTSTAMYLNL